MKIKSVAIKNLRSFEDVTVDFDNYNSLVGANGAGKSTILFALNTFFQHTEDLSTDVTKLNSQDFHLCVTENPIEITVTFCELSAQAEEEFKQYVRKKELVVTARATFNDDTDEAEVKQFAQRMGVKKFATFFEEVEEGISVSELKKTYENIRVAHPDYSLPAPSSKQKMIDALHDYEDSHPDACELIPSRKKFFQPNNAGLLAKHVQWVYVPAVKDATEEYIEGKDNAFGKIIALAAQKSGDFKDRVQKEVTAFAEKKYDELVAGEQAEVLDEISQRLTERLKDIAHPGTSVHISWSDPERSVKIDKPIAKLSASEDGLEKGDITRFGHGLQRSYLLALLQELADAYSAKEADATDTATPDATIADTQRPTVIIGFEEPELYQHPPQAKHLANVLQKLSGDNAQVIVSTHSPYFVSGQNFENLRMVRRDHATGKSYVSRVTFDEIAKAVAEATGDAQQQPNEMQARMQQALQPQLNEMFFAPKLILVEGPEDIAYINAGLVILGLWDEFRASGAHIIPVGGKAQFLRPLLVAKELGIPTFTIFDGDGDKQGENKKQNTYLLEALEGGDPSTPFPAETKWEDSFVQWVIDIRSTFEEEINQKTPDAWENTRKQAREKFGNPKNFDKNPTFIGHHLKILSEANLLPPSLKDLCEKIMAFASGN